ncbi:MAG: leucyl aminopeptidase family protein [Myxococcota bacterium]
MAATLTPVASLEAGLRNLDFDALVLIVGAFDDAIPAPVRATVAAAVQIDAAVKSTVTLHYAETVHSRRLIISPTGPLFRDQDDVRRIADAAAAGVRRARDAGAKRPLLHLCGVPEEGDYENALAVALLGAFDALWEPLEARESLGETVCEPVETLGAVMDAATVRWVESVEIGRRIARDIGGTEPERMTPIRMAELCHGFFSGTRVHLEIEDDLSAYPLASAVARASMAVARHHPRIIRLVYEGAGPIEQTLLFAGKGLSYDTGGADIKAGGHMAGMSRDKGGGAAVAGFFAAAAQLQPAGVRLIAEIGAVRNSVGADSFVSDEIIKSHAGVRVRIGNTDAEGRLVLADCLSHLRQAALREDNPRMFSVATLTGHSYRAVGPYSIAMDNGPARALQIARSLETVGDLWGDPFAISRLRREDFQMVRPRTRADDVLSCNNLPSTGTPRGHQFPMAFLVRASGLEQHGRGSGQPLPYTHIDIGGSGVAGGDWQHGRPTAAPVLALAARFFTDAG